MDLYKDKALYCPACGEKLFLKARLGGLSKRETIYYFKCEGCGLRTGKRLSVDEAVAAATPSEKALAMHAAEAPEETPFAPRLRDEAEELLTCAERVRNLEHRIVMVRERHEDEPGFELILKRDTKEILREKQNEDGETELEPVIIRGWQAVYYSQESRRLDWEDATLPGLLDQVEADVRRWEEEA